MNSVLSKCLTRINTYRVWNFAVTDDPATATRSYTGCLPLTAMSEEVPLNACPDVGDLPAFPTLAPVHFSCVSTQLVALRRKEARTLSEIPDFIRNSWRAFPTCSSTPVSHWSALKGPGVHTAKIPDNWVKVIVQVSWVSLQDLSRFRCCLKILRKWAVAPSCATCMWRAWRGISLNTAPVGPMGEETGPNFWSPKMPNFLWSTAV
jgi:hypothetical protein